MPVKKPSTKATKAKKTVSAKAAAKPSVKAAPKAKAAVRKAEPKGVRKPAARPTPAVPRKPAVKPQVAADVGDDQVLAVKHSEDLLGRHVRLTGFIDCRQPAKHASSCGFFDLC